jgi:branched-chain amino acid aminotransferase
MSENKVSIDGVVLDGERAQVSVFDRGFLYGDSVFEVFRTYGGVPFAMTEHLERLVRSAERLLIRMPVSIDRLSEEIAAAIAAAGSGDHYVRVIITRGSGPLTYDPLSASNPLRVVIVAPVKPPAAELYDRGVAVAILEASRPTDDARAAGAKASNYLANLLAVHEVQKQGAHEALVLGRRGQVLEGASSNIFIVKDGKLLTPKPEPGVLVGITRATVLRVAEELGIPVEETELRPEVIYAADEAFITSSIREVMPVVSVDGGPVGEGKPGPVTKRLRQGYLRAVAAATGAAI